MRPSFCAVTKADETDETIYKVLPSRSMKMTSTWTRPAVGNGLINGMKLPGVWTGFDRVIISAGTGSRRIDGAAGFARLSFSTRRSGLSPLAI
jgi:hypothetical protein